MQPCTQCQRLNNEISVLKDYLLNCLPIETNEQACNTNEQRTILTIRNAFATQAPSLSATEFVTRISGILNIIKENPRAHTNFRRQPDLPNVPRNTRYTRSR